MASAPPLSANPQGLELLQSMWIEFAITTIVLAARFFTRIWLVRKVSWDDYTIFAGFLINLGAFIFNNLAVNSGFGVHAKELDPQLAITALKWAFLAQVLGITACMVVRIAFVLTLIALLSPQQRIQLWLLRALLFMQVVINVLVALYILLQCKPTYGLWDHTTGAVCQPPIIQEHIGFSQGTINSFSDLALAIFPATVIWKLNMKRSVKISLIATMSLSVFAFATSVLKTVSLTTLDSDPTDLTYLMFPIHFWFSIENTTLIVCATIPTLRPLFNLGRRRATHASNSSPYHYNRSDGRSTFRRWNDTLGRSNGGGVSGNGGIISSHHHGRSRGAANSLDRFSDQVELTSKSGNGSDFRADGAFANTTSDGHAGGDRDLFMKTGTEAECVAVPAGNEERGRGGRGQRREGEKFDDQEEEEAPPETGIRKTVRAYVTY